MKNCLLLIALIPSCAFCQFEIGHTQMTFIDASRDDRSILAELYYPALTEEEDAVAADGEFPQITFGHGFVMGYNAYQNIWEHLVPQGYVMAFVTTEGGIAPSHSDFGLDLAFVLNELNLENENTSSILYNHLNDVQGLMGHSMGGGSSWLAASQNVNVDFVIGLAPAETNPSAIDAAAQVYCPVLVLSGSADAVTPPTDHHMPIYEVSNSVCKYFVNVVDGSHCGFANAGSLCDFGELGFDGIARELQQTIMNSVIDLWLENITAASLATSDFQNYFEGNSEAELTYSCVGSVCDCYSAPVIYPIPVTTILNITTNWQNAPSDATIFDVCGKLVHSSPFYAGAISLDLSALSNGYYVLRVSNKLNDSRVNFVVQH